jgi:hypothetical protein
MVFGGKLRITYIPKNGNEIANNKSKFNIKAISRVFCLCELTGDPFWVMVVFEMSGKDQVMEVNTNTNMNAASIGNPLALQVEFLETIDTSKLWYFLMEIG